MRTHQLGGRKREERVGELRNVAGHKRGLTNWRGGRGRSGLVSSETWEVINEDSLTGGEEEGGAGWSASKGGRVQMRTHRMEGRKREEREGGDRREGRHKRGITQTRGGRGKSGLVSFKTWHITNEDSLAGGEKVGEAGW